MTVLYKLDQSPRYSYSSVVTLYDVVLQAFPREVLRVEHVEAVQCLDELSELQDNWDGYGAPRLDRAVTDNARVALRLFLSRGLVPEITPTSNGTVSFEWEGDHAEAYFEVGQTTFSMYVKPFKGVTSYFDGKVAEMGPVLAEELAEAMGRHQAKIRPSVTQISYDAVRPRTPAFA